MRVQRASVEPELRLSLGQIEETIYGDGREEGIPRPQSDGNVG